MLARWTSTIPPKLSPWTPIVVIPLVSFKYWTTIAPSLNIFFDARPAFGESVPSVVPKHYVYAQPLVVLDPVVLVISVFIVPCVWVIQDHAGASILPQGSHKSRCLGPRTNIQVSDIPSIIKIRMRFCLAAIIIKYEATSVLTRKSVNYTTGISLL